MVSGISLMLWAGWHNLRERRLEQQQQAQRHIDLVPGGSNGSAQGGGDEQLPSLVGKPAPAFSLVTLEGKRVTLAEYKGRPLLINFWATWCAPCKLEMPWFEEFRTQYAPQGFEILGIAEDDAGKDEIAKVARQAGVTYPVLLTDGKVAPAYGGVDVLPMSFYIDRNGVIVEQTAGLGGKDEIEANIRKVVATPAQSGGTATAAVAAPSAAGAQ
ncbi:MAG: TlpA family protein disulfide reductase [Acidobacteriota bacterium]|nr:TlpA family protein disulfide reductase [Acidobacteriota bacterium]